jgi:hypothetical protein
MARPTSQVLWDQWRRRIEKQRASGLSVVEFCQREQISSHRFHVWKRKLRQATVAGQRSVDTTTRHRGRREPAVTTPRRRRLSRVPTGAGVTTGHLAWPGTLRGADAPGFLQLPVTAMRPSPWIELALADGTVIRLPQQNVAALLAVLRLLGGKAAEPASEDRHA